MIECTAECTPIIEAKNKIDRLKKENKELKDEVYDWKASAEDYLKLGKSLQKENKELKTKIDSLDETIKNLSSDYQRLTIENRELKRQLRGLL